MEIKKRSAESVRKWRQDFKARDLEGYKAKRREWDRNSSPEAKAREAIQARRRSLRALYGITLEDYDKKFEEQGKVCALCGQPPSENEKLAVDHNHDSGEVRALVHKIPCNVVIGHVETYGPLYSLAVQYLEKFRVEKIL